MQDCFREHPDIYAAELEDENESAPQDAPKSEEQESSDSKKESGSEDKPLDQPPTPLERPKESK
jgi:hypothetical protein